MNVLEYSALPTRLPVYPTATLYLLLDHFNAPGWAWGAALAMVVLGWVALVIRISKEHNVPLKELQP